MKNAAKLLFGKPIYYSDVNINDEKQFADWVGAVKELTDENSGDEIDTDEKSKLTRKTEYSDALKMYKDKVKRLKHAVDCVAFVGGAAVIVARSLLLRRLPKE